MRKKWLATLSFLLLSPTSNLAIASAGWYPTHVGEFISVDFCLPSAAKSPVFLQTMDLKKSQGTTLAVIHFSKLKRSSGCLQELKNGLGRSNNGPYELIYDWKVNILESNALQLYIPNLHKAIYGFPDGISLSK